MEENYRDKIDKEHLPKHVAIIMDGNGRWAKMQNKPRIEGHREGANALKRTTDAAIELGIPYMTVYAFSTENWTRPKQEVKFLMNLLSQGIDRYRKDAMESGIRIKVIGDPSRLDKNLQKKLKDVEEITKDHDTLTLLMAINYGGRDEITRGIKKLGQSILNEEIALTDIDEKLVDGFMDTAGIPDPDLLIRTSGEQRLSNYLLWQLAYSEFYFPEVKWPDFSAKDLYAAVYHYQSRNRRFGAL